MIALPQVEASGRSVYVFVAPHADGTGLGSLNAFGLDPDGASLATWAMDRPLIVARRLPDSRRPEEVVVNEVAARRLPVGTTFPVYAYSGDQLAAAVAGGSFQFGSEAPKGPSYDLKVVGIVRWPQSVNAINDAAGRQHVIYEGQENVYLIRAFLER